jgi:nucleoside-diphosphate-sugar epimerase
MGRSMRLLVTGGTGFIGSHLVEMLCQKNELFCLTQDKDQARSSLHVEWVVQDLGSPMDETKLPGHIDAIIHLAQSRHYREFPERSWDIFDVNIRSTLSLLEYGRKIGINKFVYASSGGIYGYSYEKFVETDSTNPINFYLTSKYSSELLIGNYNPYFSTVVFRFFFVYGPKQKGMLIPRLIENVRKGEPIIIYGKSGVRINPIHVQDAIRAFQPSLETPVSGVLNIAGDEVVSIKELSETIGRLVGKDPVFIYEKSNIPGDIIGDNSRMKSVLGVVPEIHLDKGIAELVKSL